MKHTLVCPFLDDDPRYACGVEFGMLWERLNDPWHDMIDDYFLGDNQEQIILACNRTGWRIVEMKPWKEGWVWFHMERT